MNSLKSLLFKDRAVATRAGAGLGAATEALSRALKGS